MDEQNPDSAGSFSGIMPSTVKEFVPGGGFSVASKEFVPSASVAVKEFVPGAPFQPHADSGMLSASVPSFQAAIPSNGLSTDSPEFTPGAPIPQMGFDASAASFEPVGQEAPIGLSLQDLYSNPNPQMTEQMLNVQYASLLPHVSRKQQRYVQNKSDPTYFTSDELRKELIGRQLAAQVLAEDPSLGIPAQVDNYHSLYPVEVPSLESGSVFGFPSIIYKGINVGDGFPYALRRVTNVKLTDVAAMGAVEKWKKIQHPNVIAIKEVFTTKDFGDNSVIFAHDFHPLAQTLQVRHLVGRTSFIPEALIWSYIIQITSALRVIHQQGLACRVIDASKIIVTGRSRIMLSSTCIFEVLQYDESQSTPAAINHFQQKDLLALGRLVLLLACNTLTEMFRDAVPHAMAHVSANYSEDLFSLIRYLLSPINPGQMGKNLNQLMPMIGARFYTELEAQADHSNLVESELSKEIQNGRLFRLMTKLEFVVDRPEQKNDPRFGETGDHFLLKLLRDYIFHQSEENGEPWLDLSHVVQCLNNLDCGSPSKICLVTPDEKNVMIVSYFDLKQCLQKAYSELTTRE